jgi:hypothetical protein
MPDGPIFRDEPIGQAVIPCRSGKGKGADWDLPCMLKILCKKDKAVIDAARTTQQIYKIKRIYFEDPYFDGAKWTTKHFEAGGTAGGGEIIFLEHTSCERAATVLYHEVWHTKQVGMDWPHPAEDDAYYNTELWTIENGYPSQGNPPLRTTDGKGSVIPDKAAIARKVDDAYPVQKTAPPEWAISDYKKAPPETEWTNRITGATVWKASKLGDTMSGPQLTEGKKTLVPAASIHCP